jgi:hypothetical protein
LSLSDVDPRARQMPPSAVASLRAVSPTPETLRASALVIRVSLRGASSRVTMTGAIAPALGVRLIEGRLVGQRVAAGVKRCCECCTAATTSPVPISVGAA